MANIKRQSSVWEEIKDDFKDSFGGFNSRNSYYLALLTLAYTCSELAHYLIGTLALPMSRDIDFGDSECYDNPDIESKIKCHTFKNNKTA